MADNPMTDGCFPRRTRSSVRLLGAAAAVFLGGQPSTVLSQAPVAAALGGDIIACRGAIAWASEDPTDVSRVDAFQIGTRDDEAANLVALFNAATDFTPEDIWTCVEGLCVAHRALHSGVTTSVLRLRRGADLGEGAVAYAFEAVFTVVGATGKRLEPASTTGTGAFICDKPLPAGVVSGDP